MKRYTQEKINKIPISTLLNLAQKGKCQVVEKRVLVKKTYEPIYVSYNPYSIFTVKFCYTLTFPETWLYERETYYVEIYDEISFKYEDCAEDYMSSVCRPSEKIEGKEYQIFLKDEYVNNIDQYLNNSYITAKTYNPLNVNVKLADGYFLRKKGYFCCVNYAPTIKELIRYIKAKYGEATETKNVAEVIEKQYSTVNLDDLIKDIEKLKTEKNKFIVDEIDRTSQYILTLKKLL